MSIHCDYKDSSRNNNNFFRKIIPWKHKELYQTTSEPEIKIDDESIFNIKSHLNDFLTSFDNYRISGQKYHLGKLHEIFNNFIPFPFFDFIIESNLISKCLNIIRRNAQDDVTYAASYVLCDLATGSPSYLQYIATEEYINIFIYHTKNTMNDYIIHPLIIISNTILDNSIFSETLINFDVEILVKILKRIDTASNEDTKLIQFNKSIYCFICKYTRHPLNNKAWMDCFSSLQFATANNEFYKYASEILRNLIIFSDQFNNNEFRLRKLNLFVKNQIVEFTNFWLFYVYYIFKFNEDSESIQDIWIPIEELLPALYQTTYTNPNNCGAFVYFIHNLLHFDQNICTNQAFISCFNSLIQKVFDFDFLTKKSFFYLCSTIVSIQSSVLFNQIQPEQYIIEIGDMIDDMENDPNFIQSIISSLKQTYIFISQNSPSDLPQLINSECVHKLQNLILSHTLDECDPSFLEMFPLTSS